MGDGDDTFFVLLNIKRQVMKEYYSAILSVTRLVFQTFFKCGLKKNAKFKLVAVRSF